MSEETRIILVNSVSLSEYITITNDFRKLEEEIERLNNIINKGIEAINVYQNEKTLSIGYQDLKRIRGILQGNEFDLQMFENYLQELKGSNEPNFEEMVGFVENVCKDIKSQPTLHEELEEERKRIAKIVGDFKEVNK